MASFYDDRVLDYARMVPKRVTFHDMLRFDPRSGNMTVHDLIHSARLVHDTMPIRIARRILDMHNLPYGIMMNSNMQIVYDFFQRSFIHLIEFPEIFTPEQETKLTEFLPGLLGSHMLPILAKASKEILSVQEAPELSRFLDIALSSRISRRILAEHHVALHTQFYAKEKNINSIGILSLACDPVEIVNRTFLQAQRICRSYYGCSPKLEFLHTKTPSKFPYIPSHLEYILLELFKNSLRATIEQTPFDKRQDALPPIQVAIFSGEDEVTIKVIDQGGGIPPEKLAHVWKYAYTTVKADDTHDGIGSLGAESKPMAGEGFGLPMARIYAQYFGGDMTMQSVHGYNTEVYIRLKHLDPDLNSRQLSDPDSREH